MMKVGAMYNCA